MRRLLCVLLGLCACGGSEPDSASPATGGDTGHPLGFTRWEVDFPIPVELSPRNPGRWYDSSRRKALESVIANLQGNCTRRAWLFAKDFFDRAPEEAIEPLTQIMDRAFLSPALGVLVQNAVEAMGRMQDPRHVDALMRAMEHSSPGVRRAAVRALTWSGTAEAVWQVYQLLPFMDLTSRRHWLESARLLLGQDAVPLFAELLDSGDPSLVSMVVEQALQMPLSQATEVLTPIWPESRGELRIAIAGILHRSGDGTGTAVLQQVLRGNDAALLQLATRAAQAGELETLLDDILKLTIHPDASVRATAAAAIAAVPGSNVTATLQVLATDSDWMVQSGALRALVRRGHRDELDRILEQLRTASGTALTHALDLVVTCEDGRAVPVILERYRKTAPGGGRGFLRAIAFTRTPEAFDALREVFLDEEQPVEPPRADGSAKTTLDYIPTLMLNARGAEQEMIQLLSDLPVDDVRRRGHMLACLGKVAADRTEPEIVAPLYDVLREVVFDRQELPQMRLAALGFLVRDLDLDDAMRLKRSLPDEELPMRKALSDFLYDLF